MLHRTRPPLNPLRCFEAAARHQSYTLAAQELSVTQVAISRQVRVLEEYLEVSLFERGARSLILSNAGRELLPYISQALDLIEEGIESISKRGKRNSLSVQVYTAFAQRWLIPRLPSFFKLHPTIDINLKTSDQPLDFGKHNVDAGIISSLSPPTEYRYTFFAERELLPVCGSDYLNDRNLPLHEKDLHATTLLHSLAQPEAWREWLVGAGFSAGYAKSGLKFQTSSMSIDAAAAGMGMAVATKMLVEDELKSGRLVAPFSHIQISKRKYYFVRPGHIADSDALLVFGKWLADQVGLGQ